MNHILTLAAAAVLLAGCGQFGLPGFGAAGTAEQPPVVVATQPAPPQTVVYEIHQDAPPAVVNNNTNTTTAAAEPAVEQVVYVNEESGHRGYRPHRPPPVIIVRPIIREPREDRRDRPRYEPPRVPDRPKPPPGMHAAPLPGGDRGGVPPGKRVAPPLGGPGSGVRPDPIPKRNGTPDSDKPSSPNNSGLSQKERG